eukprot:snap_masked-scaffold_9-processed-gene-13.98-mRNA-1 protein AED:1.00 eAED:1.00 QI:0/-1/0/0/-1/1/1/0/68
MNEDDQNLNTNTSSNLFDLLKKKESTQNKGTTAKVVEPEGFILSKKINNKINTLGIGYVFDPDEEDFS